MFWAAAAAPWAPYCGAAGAVPETELLWNQMLIPGRGPVPGPGERSATAGWPLPLSWSVVVAAAGPPPHHVTPPTAHPPTQQT